MFVSLYPGTCAQEVLRLSPRVMMNWKSKSYATERGCLWGQAGGRSWGAGAPQAKLFLLRTLGAVERTTLVATLDALAIELAADDVVTHAGKIVHATAADQHEAVFLEVVLLTADIGGDFLAVREAHTRDLAKGRVRLLRGHGLDLQADAALERVVLELRALALAGLGLAPLADQLINRGH